MLPSSVFRGLRGFRANPAATFCTTIEPPKPPRRSTSRPRSGPRAPVVINEDDLVEKFARGGGPGGQSVNKARNKVQLLHVPTGITVHVHEQRDLTTNRSIARKLLKDKIDLLLNGDASRMGQRVIREKRRKGKAASRARKKYGDTQQRVDQVNQVEEEEEESGEEDDDDNNDGDGDDDDDDDDDEDDDDKGNDDKSKDAHPRPR